MSGAFHHAAIALAETTGFSAEEHRILIGLIKRGASRGEALEDLHAAALARLGGRDFDWPEFDRWQAFFARRRQFPPLWDELKRPPTFRAAPEVHRAYRARKLYLFLDWLQCLDTTRAELRTALARYAKLGVGARITRQGDGVPCPVCDGLNSREVKGTPRELPPFHPGCRCLILPIVETGSLSRSK